MGSGAVGWGGWVRVLWGRGGWSASTSTLEWPKRAHGAWEGRERKCLGNVSEMSRPGAWEGRRARRRLGAAPFYSVGSVSQVSLKCL